MELAIYRGAEAPDITVVPGKNGLAWAGTYLDRWCARVMRSKLELMKKVAKTVCRHKPLILNRFKAGKPIQAVKSRV